MSIHGEVVSSFAQPIFIVIITNDLSAWYHSKQKRLLLHKNTRIGGKQENKQNQKKNNKKLEKNTASMDRIGFEWKLSIQKVVAFVLNAQTRDRREDKMVHKINKTRKYLHSRSNGNKKKHE